MKFPTAPLWALALAAATACGGDSSAPQQGGNTLSTLEALGLAEAYFNTVWGEDAQGAPRPALSLVPDTTIHDQDSTLPCSLGGNIQLAFQDTVIADADAQSMRINVGGTHTPVNCTLRARATNITINGDPHFVFASHSGFLGGQPLPVIESMAGDFTWTAPAGRHGECAVIYQRTVNPTTGSDQVQGTICGVAF